MLGICTATTKTSRPSKLGSGGGAKWISADSWLDKCEAAARAAPSNVSREVGTTRATTSGLAGADLWGRPSRTSRPGTESAGPATGAGLPGSPLETGPTENFASREVSGSGAVSLAAGFNPITATSTVDEGNPARSSVGASTTGGKPCAIPGLAWSATGGTKRRGTGLMAGGATGSSAISDRLPERTTFDICGASGSAAACCAA